MAKDEQRERGETDDSSESHAADEPTAVWDFEALRKAGLSELAQAPETPETGPATPADGMAARRASIIVEDKGPEVAGAPPAPEVSPIAPPIARPAPQLAESAGLSWLSLIALAALAGGLAYAAIRFLR